MMYNNHFNPFPYLIIAIYTSLIFIGLAGFYQNIAHPKPLPKVEIPHNEVEITFISK